MPKIEIAYARCKGCELCVSFCPRNCIELGTNINEQGYYFASFTKPEDCTGCAICGETCPDIAIEVWR